jgi:hypothetical protein
MSRFTIRLSCREEGSSRAVKNGKRAATTLIQQERYSTRGNRELERRQTPQNLGNDGTVEGKLPRYIGAYRHRRASPVQQIIRLSKPL